MAYVGIGHDVNTIGIVVDVVGCWIGIRARNIYRGNAAEISVEYKWICLRN